MDLLPNTDLSSGLEIMSETTTFLRLTPAHEVAVIPTSQIRGYACRVCGTIVLEPFYDKGHLYCYTHTPCN